MRSILVELKNNWIGYLVFLVVMALVVGGFVQAFPSVSEAFEDDLEGSENIEISVTEGDDHQEITLEWIEKGWAHNYTLKVGVIPQMLVPEETIEGISENNYTYRLNIEDDEIPERYFMVVAVGEEEEGNRRTEMVGIESNVERTVGLQAFGIDYSDLRSILSMFWGIFFILLIAIYIAYISVNSVSKDYDDGRMDILLTKPVSRRRYLLEKFFTISSYTLVLLTVVGLVTVASVHSLGELSTVSASTLFITTLLSWPVFLVIIAATFLAAVYLEDSKKAGGFAFLFVLIQFGLETVGDLTQGLEYLRSFSVISYWDHNSLFFGEAINWGEIGLLFVVAAVLLIIALTIFEKKDVKG